MISASRLAMASSEPPSSESGKPRNSTSVSVTPSTAQARRVSASRTSTSSSGGSVTGSALDPSLTMTIVTGVPTARLRITATAQPNVSSSGCGATTRHDDRAMLVVTSVPRRVHTHRNADRASIIASARAARGSRGIDCQVILATASPSAVPRARCTHPTNATIRRGCADDSATRRRPRRRQRRT
ncbi:hypothetical protein FAIPA1_70069 [Frankia sp. AiPs1]